MQSALYPAGDLLTPPPDWTPAERSAAFALVGLIRAMRETGRKCGRVETIIEDGEPVQARIVRAGEEVRIRVSG